ncbi:M48 family metallopeptidase [Corallococcus terminator]|uniref:Peptidase M48 domain-containing protein n=1 Tax=Corallococcus terminator TaxID=2316733 RepID=A0A3A8IW24_9BACT|nr:M48 family metallopeptidase [Corallococcus terminator]RKG84054.1 hypothetical protein D7V88_22800 [Corallococcus terminator]
MRRILFPLLALLGVLTFGLTALASVALSLLLPLVLFGLGAAALSSMRPVLAARAMLTGFKGMGAAWQYLGVFARCVLSPLREMEERQLADCPLPSLSVRLKPAQFLALHRLQQQVATATGTAPVDVFELSPDTALGIAVVRAGKRSERVLYVGLGLLLQLSMDQLAAALAHELGHARAGHPRIGRWVHHCMRMVLDAQSRFGAWNPARWGSWVAHEVLSAVYFPWSREREFQADRISAQVVGANHMVAALRAVRDGAPAYEFALDEVLRQAHAVPTPRLCETSAALAAALPPAMRRQLAVKNEGDPLELGGLTHPPTALRITALTGLPSSPVTDARPAYEALGATALDERLTRHWLLALGVNATRETEPRRHAAPAQPDRPDLAPSQERPDSAPEPSGLELDMERSWQSAPLLHRDEAEVEFKPDLPVRAGRGRSH